MNSPVEQEYIKITTILIIELKLLFCCWDVYFMNNSTTLSTVCNKKSSKLCFALTRCSWSISTSTLSSVHLFYKKPINQLTRNVRITNDSCWFTLQCSLVQRCCLGLLYTCPLIVLCFSTGTIRLLHSCFSCRETVTGSKWVLTDSTNLSDNTFFKIISIFLIFNELKHAYNMDDIVLSSEMETDLVYQLLIKWTPSVKRQCNNWLQYETYCAQLEVFVQSSPWSLS